MAEFWVLQQIVGFINQIPRYNAELKQKYNVVFYQPQYISSFKLL